MTENACIAHSFRQVFGQAYTCIYIILHKLTYIAYHCIPWHEDIAISCSLSLSLHYMTFALHLPYIAFHYIYIYINDIEWKWLCLKVGYPKKKEKQFPLGQAAGCGQSSLAHLSPAKGWKWWLNDFKRTWWFMVIEFFPTLYENDITQRDFCLGWNMKGKGFVVGFFRNSHHPRWRNAAQIHRNTLKIPQESLETVAEQCTWGTPVPDRHWTAWAPAWTQRRLAHCKV